MKHSYQRRILLIGWLFSVATVLYFIVCMLLPNVLQLPLLMIACVFSVPLTMEFNIKGLIVQIACIAIVLFLRFGFTITAPYLLFLSYYAPFKFFLEHLGGFLGFLGKVTYYCLGIGLCMLLFPTPLFSVYSQLPWYLLILLMFAFFGLADIAVSLFAAFYNSVLRRKLL
jgi:hypothetical protein